MQRERQVVAVNIGRVEVAGQLGVVSLARDGFRFRHRRIVRAGNGDLDRLGRGDVAIGHFVREGLDRALAVVQSLSGLSDIEAVGAIGVDRQGAVLALTIALEAEGQVIAIDIGRIKIAGQVPASSLPATDSATATGPSLDRDRDRDRLSGGDVTIGHFVGEGLNCGFAVVQALSRGTQSVKTVGASCCHRKV